MDKQKRYSLNQQDNKRIKSFKKMKNIGHLFTSTVQEYGRTHGRIYLPRRLRKIFNIEGEKKLVMSFHYWKKYVSLEFLPTGCEPYLIEFKSAFVDKQGRIKIEDVNLRIAQMELFEKVFIENCIVYFCIWSSKAWKVYEKSEEYKQQVQLLWDVDCIEQVLENNIIQEHFMDRINFSEVDDEPYGIEPYDAEPPDDLPDDLLADDDFLEDDK